MRRVPYDVCWIGRCAGCGRPLISATWGTNLYGEESAQLGYYDNHPVFCTKRCRIANEHRIPFWSTTARRQEHKKLRKERGR